MFPNVWTILERDAMPHAAGWRSNGGGKSVRTINDGTVQMGPGFYVVCAVLWGREQHRVACTVPLQRMRYESFSDLRYKRMLLNFRVSRFCRAPQEDAPHVHHASRHRVL